MYQKNVVKKNMLVYVLMKYFDTFIYDHTLYRGRKHFYHYCLQAFSTKEILKCHIKDCFIAN